MRSLRAALNYMAVARGLVCEKDVEVCLAENIAISDVLIELVEQSRTREDASTAHELMFDKFSKRSTHACDVEVAIFSPKKARLDTSSSKGFARGAGDKNGESY